MAHRKVTEDQGFTLLRVAGQGLHRKLRQIADDVIETGAQPSYPSRSL